MLKIIGFYVFIRFIWKKWSDFFEKRIYRSNNGGRKGGWMFFEFVLENWNIFEWN